MSCRRGAFQRLAGDIFLEEKFCLKGGTSFRRVLREFLGQEIPEGFSEECLEDRESFREEKERKEIWLARGRKQGSKTGKERVAGSLKKNEKVWLP